MGNRLATKGLVSKVCEKWEGKKQIPFRNDSQKGKGNSRGNGNSEGNGGGGVGLAQGLVGVGQRGVGTPLRVGWLRSGCARSV